MCFIVDGYCEIYEQTIRKARKAHKCRSCNRQIVAGEQYLSIFSVYEGDADRCSICNQCAQDAVAIHRAEVRAGCEADWDSATWAPWAEVHCVIRQGNADEGWEREFTGDNEGYEWGPVLFWPYGVAPAHLPVDLKTIPEYAT